MSLFSKIFSICILAATDFQEVEFGRGGRRIFKRRGDDAALPALETKEEKAKKKREWIFGSFIYRRLFLHIPNLEQWTLTPPVEKRGGLCALQNR